MRLYLDDLTTSIHTTVTLSEQSPESDPQLNPPYRPRTCSMGGGTTQACHNIPLPTCSFLSSQTLFPEHEHTTLSLSQTPALLAVTPTRVFGSSGWSGPFFCPATTILRPITSQIAIALSMNALPLPSLLISIKPKSPRGGLGASATAFAASQIPPVDCAPREISPFSRIVAW